MTRHPRPAGKVASAALPGTAAPLPYHPFGPSLQKLFREGPEGSSSQGGAKGPHGEGQAGIGRESVNGEQSRTIEDGRPCVAVGLAETCCRERAAAETCGLVRKRRD